MEVNIADILSFAFKYDWEKGVIPNDRYIYRKKRVERLDTSK